MSKIVKRTLDFIDLFAKEKRPLSLSEISRLLGIPMSSCFDVIRSLQERGYVYELGQRAGYYPTQKLKRMADEISKNDPIVERAGIKLRGLRDEFDESVSLAVSTGRQVTYLLVFEPSHALRFLVAVGDQARSLHATSVGKALLSTLSSDAFEEEIAKGLKPMTEHTITDPDVLRRDIRDSAARGYFINREESILTGLTVTTCFRWNRSDYFITMAGASYRFADHLDRAIVRMTEVGRELEAP